MKGIRRTVAEIRDFTRKELGDITDARLESMVKSAAAPGEAILFAVALAERRGQNIEEELEAVFAAYREIPWGVPPPPEAPEREDAEREEKGSPAEDR